MNPTISLGPWDSPDMEIAHRDLYPLLAALIQHNDPLTSQQRDAVVMLLECDGIHLREDTVEFFSMFEDICSRIEAGEVTSYSPDWLDDEEFQMCTRRFSNDGGITPGARSAASTFTRFLAANPNNWPLR